MITWSRRNTLRALFAAGASTVPITWAAAETLREQGRPAPGDFMSRSLRKRVEALKAGVAAKPSDDANFKERALTLYDWMNALALRGLYLHPDIPQLITTVNAPGFLKTGERARRGNLAALDQHVRTLGALEANPDLCGKVTAKVEEPMVADTHVEFRQTYTVGDAPIRAGGGMVLPNHFYFSFAELQTTDPKADNYVSLTVSNPSVRFVADTYPIAGMFSMSLGIGETPRVFFRITEGELRKGDTMTVTYGDRSKGSKGLRLIQVSNSAVHFPLWLLTEEKGILLTPREAVIAVSGGPAAAVHGFVPSVVGVGESFTLSVRTEDKFRNLATGGAPGWTVTLNGRPFRTIPASANPITVLSDVRIDKPGVYRFAFVSADGKLTGSSDPVLVEVDPKERIFWGETHGHCGFSEGMGKVDDYFKFARDESRLDFVSLTEHDLWLDASEWEEMRRAAKKFNAPGKFVTYLGYEWTVTAAYGGHHNVIFRNLDGVEPVASQLHPALPDLYRGLRQRYATKDVMVIPHAHMTADATQNDKELEPLVEIASEHGIFEWLGRRYLANGFQLGFVGASDDHLGHPGYKMRPVGQFYFDGPGGLAGVYAPSKDRNVIFDAMKSRRTYATTQDRIILRTRLNGRHMGEVVPTAATRIIEGVVHGTGPIQSITLVKNGKDHQTQNFEASGGEGTENIVEVRFESTSEPLELLQPSRGERVWAGKLTVVGASILGVSSPQVEALNHLSEWVRPNPADPNSVDFRLTTRGYSKAVRLRLAGDPTAAKIEVTLTGRSAPQGVKTLQTPAPGAAPFTLVAPDKIETQDRLAASGVFNDTISVRQIRPAVQLDREFRFVETGPPQVGDNYYVRVVQADGACAWSSPGWVGAVRSGGSPGR